MVDGVDVRVVIMVWLVIFWVEWVEVRRWD